jgi:hypothetical protein
VPRAAVGPWRLPRRSQATVTWQAFVIAYGWHAFVHHLAHVVGQSEASITRLRNTGACTPLVTKLGFEELFSKWHGRAPHADDWPAPRVVGGGYEWLANEDALLARLVGTMPTNKISAVLTTRLRLVTGDGEASRNGHHVQVRINRIGLQAGDLLGGLTTTDAAKIVGRVSLINQAINLGRLKTIRVGKRHVIPQSEFQRWLSTRDEPPVGWVRLASLAKPLGISSDSKLPEYAALGYIPDVVRVGICTPRGTWFIAPERAQQILDDALAGRPLPWYGKPLPGNQKAMFRKWQARKHRRCNRCATIWNGAAPRTFEAFCARYGDLTLGEKRHISRDTSKPKSTVRWRPRGSVVRRMRDAGVTVYEAAPLVGRRSRWIRAWMRQGLLNVTGAVVRDELGGEAVRITPLGVEILRAAAADQEANVDSREWIGVHVAAQVAGVCIATVHKWRAGNKVVHKRGPHGILFELESLRERTRMYWSWASTHFKRPDPPAWLRDEAA